MMKSYWIIGGILLVLFIGGVIYIMQRPQITGTATPAVSTSPVQTESSPAASETATSSGDQTEVKVIEVIGSNFKFSPAEIRVKQGDRVRIHFIAQGGIHDLVIDEYNVATKQTSSEDTIEFVADKIGTFEYYCSISNHRRMGMVGNLIVE